MKRAILYARVSGDDRRGATSSISAQLAEGRKYCEQRGYRVVEEVFEDPNRQTSGADWLPGLERIVQSAPSGMFDVVVCYSIDRLARSRLKQLLTEVELEAHAVAVEYVATPTEDTAEGKLLRGLLSEFAQFERDTIRRRTQNGTLRSVAAGNVTIGGPGAPYGYDIVTATDPATGKPRRSLVVNETEAVIVRQMFEMYAGGASLYTICAWLGEHCIPLPGKGNNAGGKGAWSVSTIARILENEVYVGKWHYRKTRSVKDPLAGKYRNPRRPREEWLEVAVPPIVGDERFAAVQRHKEANKRELGRQRKHTYAVGGMVTCGHCGKSVVGIAKDGGKYRYYLCAAFHTPRQYGYKCDLPSFRANHVEAAVWQWIKSLLLEPDTLRRQLLAYQQQERDRVQPQLAMLENSQARLGELEGRKERLIAAYTTGVLTLDELAAQKNTLDKEIGELTQAIAAFARRSRAARHVGRASHGH